ncbi:hypothetical protein [Streptomyces sp. 351MFTsu5.1]|uniref:hypothetical protein n=1 Tax=Streptomyces sp. 351MFTsu5.1 TaxID=1172180 RepID=UPI0003606E50|nr:hypothetical protein [Streptomyces sp. 351MFTsu5.1]
MRPGHVFPTITITGTLELPATDLAYLPYKGHLQRSSGDAVAALGTRRCATANAEALSANALVRRLSSRSRSTRGDPEGWPAMLC